MNSRFDHFSPAVTLFLICFTILSCDNPVDTEQPLEITWQKINTFETRTQFLTEGPDGQLYATIYGHGVHRSVDNGITWERIFWPASGQIVINTDEHIFVYGRSIYRSLDNGNSWTELTISDSTHVSVRFMAINSKGHILASDFRGDLYRSIDNGDSWTKISLGGSVGKVIINNDDQVFAITSIGVFRSVDSGDTWTENVLIEGWLPLLVFNPDYHIYAVTNGDSIIRSIDNGNTWEQLGSLPLPPEDTFFNLIAINSKNHIFVSTEELPVFDTIDQGQGVFRSKDNGESWTNIGPDSASIKVLFLDSKGYLFVAAKDNLYRSSEPTTH